jgi:hypothetical protein
MPRRSDDPMNDLIGVLGALSVLVLPLALAWLLLKRDPRAPPPRQHVREKMPR